MTNQKKADHAKLIELRDHAQMAAHLANLLVDLSYQILERDPESPLSDQINHIAKKLELQANAYGRNIHARLGAV